MRDRRLLLVLAAACALAAASSAAGPSDPRSAVAAEPAAVGCRDGGNGARHSRQRGDVAIGPLSIMGARRTPRQRRDAFEGHGWKLPALLDNGVSATLSVPPRLRGKVGFVYELETQARVGRRGVRAAGRAVSFTACTDEGARTGWPGGIVVDRRRCATLLVELEGAPEPIRKRVSLGRRCPRA